MICEESGKQIQTKGKADAQLRSLKKLNDYEGEVYPCEYCKGYHVGRKKKWAHKNKYA